MKWQFGEKSLPEVSCYFCLLLTVLLISLWSTGVGDLQHHQLWLLSVTCRTSGIPPSSFAAGKGSSSTQTWGSVYFWTFALSPHWFKQLHGGCNCVERTSVLGGGHATSCFLGGNLLGMWNLLFSVFMSEEEDEELGFLSLTLAPGTKANCPISKLSQGRSLKDVKFLQFSERGGEIPKLVVLRER